MELIIFNRFTLLNSFSRDLTIYFFFQKWNCVVVLDSRDLTKLFFFQKLNCVVVPDSRDLTKLIFFPKLNWAVGVQIQGK